MKPSSAIALVSSRPGAATPLAFFFSQPVTNVAARTQSNVDAIAFGVLIFIETVSIELQRLAEQSRLRGSDDRWRLPSPFAGGQNRGWSFLRPIQAHYQVDGVVGSGQPVGLLCLARRVFLDIQ